MKRVFIAAEISAEARAAAAEHIMEMRRRFRDVRASWVRPGNLHITVRFFGEAEEVQVSAIAGLAGSAAAECSPFTVRLSGTGSFGSKVLFIGLEDESGGFAALNRRIESGVEGIGFRTDTRLHQPHLTLARIRTGRGVRPLIASHTSAEIPPLEFTIAEIVLFESTLTDSGSIYTPLARFPLSGNGIRV